MRTLSTLSTTCPRPFVIAALLAAPSLAGTQQQAFVKASNTDIGDQFGAVAVSGGTMVAGARGESSNANGVDGDQTDNSAPSAGAAYVYTRTGSTWTPGAYLKASNSSANDLFGSAVAISGDTIVVGAPEASGYGRVYVFVRQAGTWSQQAMLSPLSPDLDDHFGKTVAIDGDTIVVGTAGDDSNATSIDGDSTNDGALQSGAAYVFVRSGSAWIRQAYLKAWNAQAGDVFGSSVGVAGDMVVVGAPGEDGGSAGTGGDPSDDSRMESGAAYVFARNGSVWSAHTYLKASNTGTGDNFGHSSAISNGIQGLSIVVGAPRESSEATGVDGDGSNDFESVSGAAYVFQLGAGWSQQAFLKASNTQQADFFGDAVAIAGEIVVVGAYNEDSAAVGVDGDQSSNVSPESGAAYVFARRASTWRQESYLKASNTDPVDLFGQFVAASGNLVVVGARMEDSNTTGINQNQNDDNFHNSGAAYVFRVDEAHASFCLGDGSGTACPCGNDAAPGTRTGCLNSTGAGASLFARGNASIGDDTLALEGAGMPSSAAVLYFQGTTQQNGGAGAVFGDGLRCAGGSITRLATKQNVGGESRYPGPGDAPISIRGANQSGQQRTYQAWYRNVASFCTPAGHNLTNGRTVSWTN